MRNVSWGLIAVLLTIACAALFPLGLIVLAPALLFGGLSARRRSRDVKTRAIADGAIAGGIAGVVLIVVMLATASFFLTTSMSGGDGSASSGPYPSTPQAIPRKLAP